jgi:hypothetical protein
MVMRGNLRFVGVALVALVGFSSTALASTEVANASTVSPTLNLSANVQKAIRLTLSQGTVSGAACAVTASSDYSMSFGNVDALGINTPSCGAKFAPTTPGTTAAAWYTDYNLTPVFTNQAVTTATVNAYVSSNFATLSSILSVVQGGNTSAAPGNIGALTAMSTSSGSQTSVGVNLASGTAVTRYIGVSVLPTNGGTVSGSDTATITYTMTAP